MRGRSRGDADTVSRNSVAVMVAIGMERVRVIAVITNVVNRLMNAGLDEQ
jgi:hypothetical protein